MHVKNKLNGESDERHFARLIHLMLVLISLALNAGCADVTSSQQENSAPVAESNDSPDTPTNRVIKFKSLDSNYEGTTVVNPDGTQTSN